MTIAYPPDGRAASRGRGMLAVVVLVTGLGVSASSRSVGAPTGIESIGPDEASNTSAAVVVSGRLNLAYTTQLWPTDASGRLVVPAGGAGAGPPEVQVGAVLDRLESTLKEAGTTVDRLVKVNVYAANLDVLPVFRAAFARRMAGRARPALCVVVGAPALADALIGLDAIAATSEAPKVGPRVAILAAGSRAWVSGQAARDPDLAAATRKTLEELGQTLAFLGLGKSDVVQVKVFLQPASAGAAVGRALAAFFGAGGVPPVVLVDWRSSKDVPVEIELVAAAGHRADPAIVDYLTPPALKPSPVFSRVARVNRGDLIFVSGLFGAAGTTGADQVEAIFGTLEDTLARANGDFRHLVKATYYVSDDEAGRALNDLRPRFYDPKGPPAASKAVVAGVGAEGRTITLDMIAVPNSGPPAAK